MRARASPPMSAVAAANATLKARGDRVVAVVEVLVEDLPADPARVDDLADRHLVDRPLVGERERRLAQPGADPLCAGIDAVRSCCHTSSVSDFVDS